MPIRIYRHVPEPGIIRYDSIAGSSTRWNCVVTKGGNGAPLYVRVGLGGAIESSPDAVTWTSRTSGTGSSLNFVLYDSYTSKYWAVGNSGTMLSSADGITWAAVSLPVEVASDTLTGIATNGAGNFVVSNSSSGSRGLVSTDSGSTWPLQSLTGSSSCVIYTGSYFIVGRTLGYVGYVPASSPTSSWVAYAIPGASSTVQCFAINNTRIIATTSTGDIATVLLSDVPSSGNWTLRRVGTGPDLRPFTANGRSYAVGDSGSSYESADDGVTWVDGPPVGVTSFLRFGVADANDPTRAIVVGDAGVTLFGQYGLRVKGYATAEDRPSNPIAQSPKFAFADQPVTGLTVDLL